MSGAISARLSLSIRHVVLTSGGDQQAGGAATISKAGRYIRVIDSIDPRGLDARASIIAHLNVLNRMSTGKSPSDSWPTDTYFAPEWSIFSNGEAVQLFHVTAATATAYDRLLSPLRFYRRVLRYDDIPLRSQRGGTMPESSRLNRVLISRCRETGGGSRDRAAEAERRTDPPTIATW
jgi:hypothetical protein